jgi:aminoglycoside 3-N-acetyltransferase I
VLDQYYSTKPLAYLYDLAVLTEYQRKGVGRKLIEFTNNYCRQEGFKEVFVQADKMDDYALDFYRSTNPTLEEQVVHFSYIFKNQNDK